MRHDRTPDEERRLLLSQLHRVQGELGDRARALARLDPVRKPTMCAAISADIDQLKTDISNYRRAISQLDADVEQAAAVPAVTR